MAHRCGSCPRLWTGLVEAHCSACHRHFSGVVAFDMHRSGDACHKPDRLRDANGKPRLVPEQRASGEVWSFPPDPRFTDGPESEIGRRTPDVP